VHGVVLVEFGNLLDLAHHDNEGRDSAKEAIFGAEIILPGSDEVREALLEELAIDLDLRHCG